MFKKLLVTLTLSLTAVATHAVASETTYGVFTALPGKSQLVTQRAGCGKVKEVPYYHRIELYKDGDSFKFKESIYIAGIEQADLILTGNWVEEKHNRIKLSYDGAVNDGSTGNNSGWAVLLGDIERQLSNICRPVGAELIAASTALKTNELKLNRRGDQAQLKMLLTSRSQGGFNKPKSTKRSAAAKGRFELLAR